MKYAKYCSGGTHNPCFIRFLYEKSFFPKIVNIPFVNIAKCEDKFLQIMTIFAIWCNLTLKKIKNNPLRSYFSSSGGCHPVTLIKLTFLHVCFLHFWIRQIVTNLEEVNELL